MKCSILHESAGRLRVRLHCPAMTLRQADVLEYYLRAVDGVTEVKVYDRTRDAVVCFACGRGDVIASLAAFSFPRAEAMDLVPEHTSRALNREFEDKLTMTVARRIISRLFLPAPVTTALARHPVGEVHPGGAFGPVAWPPVRGRAGRHRRHRVHGPGRFRHRPGP